MIHQLWHPSLFSCLYSCNSLNLGSVTHAGEKPGVSCGLLGLCEGTTFITLHHTTPFPVLGSTNNLKMANGFLKFILNIKRLLKILGTISQGIGRFRVHLCFYVVIMANPNCITCSDLWRSVSPYNIGEFIGKVLKETTNLTMGYAHI